MARVLKSPVHIHVRRKKLHAEVDDLQDQIDNLLAADAALDD